MNSLGNATIIGNALNDYDLYVYLQRSHLDMIESSALSNSSSKCNYATIMLAHS